MQLKSLFSILFLGFGILLAQEEKPIEVDFLLNYYGQDGDHSGVTGGTGTEELTNTGVKIIINIPKGDNKSYNISLNADAYSSASSDEIDPVRSGASDGDLHAYANFDYNVDLPESNSAYSLSAGLSTEYDYFSFSFGGSWSFYSKDKNREFTVGTMNFIDQVTKIYPIEIRGRDNLLSDDQRQTYSASLTYNQVITKKLQMSFMTDLVYQQGLLSTSFNRVYFKDSDQVDIERLPDSRFKFPVGVRLNYFISDMIVARLHYRLYNDDFGISSNTVSLETPLRINQTWALIPFVRYHDQQAADYFQPFEEHTINDEFYTSDYDLSSFTSFKYGLGVRYYPLETITSILGAPIKRLDFRVGLYDRSDGLSAYNATVGVSFSIP